jgi:rhodanese-related sulfurtransferase
MEQVHCSVPRIAAEEALARLRRGEPLVFVDARREVEWRRAYEKLPGAVRLAPDGADETLPIIRRGQTAVVYCTCPCEASSVVAAEHLRAHGYHSVYVLFGGLPAWHLAQGPVEPVRAARPVPPARVAAPLPEWTRRQRPA